MNFVKKTTLVTIIIFISFVITACKKDKAKKLVITMSLSNNYVDKLSPVVEAFNEQNGNYTIKLDVVENENAKNYKLVHNKLNGDLIVFDNYATINNYGKYLYNLKRCEVVSKYQSSIINNMKTFDNKLYGLPSIGRLYTNCYNVALLNDYNYTIPSNLDDLLNLAKRMQPRIEQDKILKTSSSIGGKDSVVFALMQFAYPYFLSTTRGNTFLQEYFAGNTKISNAENIEYFELIFKNLLYSYNLNLYSLKDLNQNISDGIAEFNNNKSVIIQNSAVSPIDNEINTSNYEFYPFVGTYANNNWLATKPLYYLSINGNVDDDTLAGCLEFLEFYSSSEGQEVAKSSIDDGNSINYISFIADTYYEISAKYKTIKETIEKGKVYLIDVFSYIFSSNVDYIISYLNNEITFENMVYNIDRNVYSSTHSLREKVAVDSDFDYDSKLIGKKELKIANFIADAFKSSAKVDSVCLQPDLIKGNIYDDGMYKDEVSFVLASSKLVYARLSVKQLKLIIQENFSSDYLPLISGFRINGFNNLKIYNSNNIELDDNKILYMLIDYALVDGKNISYGKSVNTQDLFKEYLNNNSKIVVGDCDNRYGGNDD